MSVPSPDRPQPIGRPAAAWYGRSMAVRRRRRVVVAGLLVLLTANSLLGLGYGLTAAATPATSLTSAAVGLVLTLILTGVLAVEWRLGDRLLASTDAARRRGDRLAHYDSLTRLPNRRVLERELAECCLGTPPLGAAFALHLVDVDDLKAINDGFGHDTGDDVLRTVAQRLRAAVRDTDLVARLAGDEFVILQRDATPATAANLAQRMVETLRLPLREHTTAIVPTVSIGTALFGPGRTQPNQLL
ncbi:MAG: GGDEF domain-containing protein, partial [Geminicoccaceae bacterium]